MRFGNPLLRFGCWANGEHVWSKKYETWRGWEHECRWCGHTERTLPPKRVRKKLAAEPHD